MDQKANECLYGNNENEFVYRTIERDLIEEEDIIDQETYFWQEHVLKNVVPPHNGNSDLVLANIRNYGGFADKSIPEIVLSGLESKNLEKYLTLSEEKSQLEKRKKEIEAEQRAISVPFVEQLGQGCKAVLEDGTNRYRITYNPTRRTSVGKDHMEKLKNQLEHLKEDLVVERPPAGPAAVRSSAPGRAAAWAWGRVMTPSCSWAW